MIKSRRQFKQGDTIVEVLFAIAIFSFVAMVMMDVMQRGSLAAQMSLEITLARNAMNSQAEAVRFVNAAIHARVREQEAGQGNVYTETWNEMISHKGAVSDWNAMIVDQGGRKVCRDIPSNAFVLDIKNLSSGQQAVKSGNVNLVRADVFPRLLYADYTGSLTQSEKEQNVIVDNKRFDKSEGIWMEVEEVGDMNKTTTAYDFHIRSCWIGSGQLSPTTQGTIVRVHVTKES